MINFLDGAYVWIVGLLSIYILIWAIPSIVIWVVLGLGSYHRIAYIDKQLAKDVDKLHSDCNCMLTYEITTRFMMYCLKYPFIRHRAKTKSRKFSLFMWANCFGFWGFALTCFIMMIDKALS